MRKETWSIGFACALGAFLGALIALELTANFSFGKYLWIIGALVGGAVAYLAYDFKAVLLGVARAWRDVSGWRPHPNRRKIKLRLMILGYIVAATSGIAFWEFALLFIPTFWSDPNMAVRLLVAAELIGVLLATLALSPMFLGTLTAKQLVSSIKIWRGLSAKCNIFAAPFVVAYYVVRGLLYIVRRIPSAMVFTVRFVKTVFFYIHSSERVLCFTDATIGASIGYFAGSALIGAIVGGLFGVLNYEVLSVRVLKLVSPR